MSLGGDGSCRLYQRASDLRPGSGPLCKGSAVSTLSPPLRLHRARLAVVVGVANAAYSRATKDSATLLDAATSTPLEAVGAIRTVNAFGREGALLSKYTQACKGARLQGLAQGLNPNRGG